MQTLVENLNAKTITPADGNNPRILYEHQTDAMHKLDEINKKDEFKSILVLPTGGGKTLTAVYWLLKTRWITAKRYFGLHIDTCFWSRRQIRLH